MVDGCGPGEYAARADGALDAVNSQRKARAELVAQRQREADVLAGLKTEQTAAVGSMPSSISVGSRSLISVLMGA